jgi:hypothetical protein
MQLMQDTQTTVSTRSNAPRRDEVVTVNIDGASAQITKRFCFAGDMADVFGIDTSVITDFDKNAVIEKVVQGPQGFESMWNVCTVMTAFVPSTWKERKYATRALAKTSIADYKSRMEVQMAHNNVRLPSFCTCNTNLYQVLWRHLVQIFYSTFNGTNFCTGY